MDEFFKVGVRKTTVLDPDEIVTEITVPTMPLGTNSVFLKFSLRKSIDFPIVNCAARVTVSKGLVAEARICLNAGYGIPLRAAAAEELIRGRSLTEENVQAAADAAVSSARPMTRNKYLVQIARTLIKRALLACA
jgi:xanthine dehydrogenase YagS FAD-binding subunit